MDGTILSIILTIHESVTVITYLYYLALGDLLRFTLFFWVTYVVQYFHRLCAAKFQNGSYFQFEEESYMSPFLLYVLLFNYSLDRLAVVSFLTSSFLRMIAFRDIRELLEAYQVNLPTVEFTEIQYRFALNVIILYMTCGTLFILKLFGLPILLLWTVGYVHKKISHDETEETLCIPVELL